VAFVTFRFIRVPRVFLMLVVCVGVVFWIGYALIGPTRVAQVTAVPAPGAGESEQPTINFAEIGREAPDFALKRLDGSVAALSGYRGRPVLLYFWASWCSYCVEGMPRLEAIRAEYQEQGLEILAIDIMESEDKVRRFVAGQGLTLPVLLDDTGQVTQQYLVKATPTYIFIDREGVYRDILVGVAREGATEGRLHPLL